MTQEQTEKKAPFRKNRFRVEIQANDKSGFNRAQGIQCCGSGVRSKDAGPGVRGCN